MFRTRGVWWNVSLGVRVIHHHGGRRAAGRGKGPYNHRERRALDNPKSKVVRYAKASSLPNMGAIIGESPRAVSAQGELEEQGLGDLGQPDGVSLSATVDGTLPAAVQQVLREQLAAGVSPEQLQRALRAIPSPLKEKGLTPATVRVRRAARSSNPARSWLGAADGADTPRSGGGDGEVTRVDTKTHEKFRSACPLGLSADRSRVGLMSHVRRR
jgi:hypothetical protein